MIFKYKLSFFILTFFVFLLGLDILLQLPNLISSSTSSYHLRNYSKEQYEQYKDKSKTLGLKSIYDIMIFHLPLDNLPLDNSYGDDDKLLITPELAKLIDESKNDLDGGADAMEMFGFIKTFNANGLLTKNNRFHSSSSSSQNDIKFVLHNGKVIHEGMTLKDNEGDDDLAPGITLTISKDHGRTRDDLTVNEKNLVNQLNIDDDELINELIE